MAAFYVDDEEVWKCLKHPSKRRRTGICPTCLRDRLITLCTDCGNVRPCGCSAAATTSSSSSSSSSFSLFSFRGGDASKSDAGIGAVDRMSNLIDGEPSLRKSRSVAIPFFRSRFGSVRESVDGKYPPPGKRTKSSFWSVFKTHKSKKGDEGREDEESKMSDVAVDDDYARSMMMRSRSVSVPVASKFGAGDFRASPAKGRGWHFPSPMKALRHLKTSKVVQERSPVYRG